MDQPGKVASRARGRLNRKNEYFLSAFVPENLVSPDGLSRPASACSTPYLGLNLVLTYGIPPEFRGGVHLFIYCERIASF